MKIFVTVLAVLAVTTYTMAAAIDREEPTRLEDVDTDGGIVHVASEPSGRYRRLTCDLLSFESSVVTPNDSGCALKCIATGKKGGHCEGSNCICREDSWIPG